MIEAIIFTLVFVLIAIFAIYYYSNSKEFLKNGGKK